MVLLGSERILPVQAAFLGKGLDWFAEGWFPNPLQEGVQIASSQHSKAPLLGGRGASATLQLGPRRW